MKLSRLLLLLSLFGGISFGQVYQGPAAGSVASGTTVSTETKMNDLGGVHFKTHPPKNIFTNMLLPTPGDVLPPTGPEGSNYHVDPLLADGGNFLAPMDDFYLTNDWQGIPDQGMYIPPDPYLAVGSNHIVTIVNSRFRIHDKTGAVQHTIEADNWFSVSGSFDPKIVYDHHDNRWVMVWLLWPTAPTAKFLISVSDDADPNGTWYNWIIPSNTNGNTVTTNAADYQGVGYDADYLYITSNQFTDGGSFQYCKLRIIPKTDLYANTAGPLNWNDLWDIKNPGGNNVFGVRPSRIYGTPSQYYLLARSEFVTGTYFTLFKVNPSGTPSMTAVNVPVTAYSSGGDAQQLGSGQTIDGGGDGIRNEPVYMNGLLHMVHSVNNGGASAVRYCAINVTSNTATTDLAMGAQNYYHTYPALAVNNSGNVVITYSRSSTTEYMGAFYTTKPASSTTLTGSKVLKPGNGTYYKTFGGTRNRWGDYNGAWLDPSNDNKIWLLTEYVASTNTWGSWVGELTYDTPTTYVHVNSPNGGEFFTIGSSENITWTSSGIANVKIEFSTNNGLNWSTVTASVAAGSGTYNWTVPAAASNNCLIRISDVAKDATTDQSDGVFTVSSGGLDWSEVTSGTSGDIWGIDWVDANVVWICASNGDVKKSTDGGNTWSAAGNAGEGAYSIAAISSTVAVVSLGPSSGNGKIMRTTNGGSTWTQVYTANGAWFNFVDNFDSNNLWAQSDPIGGTFHIVKSTDGGATWSLAPNPPAQPTSTVFGANGSFYRVGNTCWFGTGGSAATNANRVYKSSNGADGPWTFGTTSDEYVGTVAFSSESGNGLAGFWSSSATNKVNKTTNGGNNWTSQAASIGDVFGLDYVRGTNYAWAGTSTGIWQTSNNGSSWTEDQIPPTVNTDIYVVRFHNDADVGLAGGAGGVLLKSLLGSVVPVEFTAFTASVNEQNISLNWSTATETNNRGFEVERKTSGSWETLSFIPGRGTTSQTSTYNFNDELAEEYYRGIVSYRLKQLDYDGSFAYSDVVNLEVDFSPKNYTLEQNYPNPFNPTTTIVYQLPVDGMVKLKVFDVLGKEVASLVNEHQTAGKYSFEFDASNLSSGVYFYRLESNGFSAMKKLILLK